MSLCPYCKKVTLVDTNPPRKTSAVSEYLGFEVVIILFTALFTVKIENFVLGVLLFVGVIGLIYAIFRKKDKNIIYRCTSCKNTFDEQTVTDAQRTF